jgi:hypothetical protein
MDWPPKAGELLPRPQEAFGIREKLRSYSLNLSHRTGWPKAQGFALILGITLDSIDYLEEGIKDGIRHHPVQAVIDNEPYGWKCVVEFPLRGYASYSDRTADVRTVWELATSQMPPRLINAIPRTR